MKSFVLHLTFEDAYECMVGQVKHDPMYGSMFHRSGNHEFEFYKKPQDTGWYKVPFRKPTRNELNGMFSLDVESSGIQWQTSWTAQVQEAQHHVGRPTVTNVHTTPGDVVFRNGSTITNHVREMERLESLREQQAAMNRHVAEHARQHRDELERREAQRIAEQQRLEAERNRPSFLRRINPFR